MKLRKQTNEADHLEEEMYELKKNMNDWVMFLNSELKSAKREINFLEQKISHLEVRHHRHP